ncbi:glycosyltransferase family 2 protein [Lutimonas zeaxanthinifaciens]|uniref:glycosyltransferase family 2 protein n=1 Tax=Lutimonas zeaxanthinifaciens TaxID=3060215 RepID=UPI00265D3551|nr:glycosyltransferase family A protein [Lutimonas sp. YSD2104]WKK67356.1 glycosyltransferase family A protein [Lutimonas sp. YSD2104]
MELVSVIMPAYNAEKYIEQAINCIIRQSYVNWELIICDDGSIDGTREIIESFALMDKRIRCYHNENNLGIVATRNKLLAKAKGEFITMLDADDLCVAERISVLRNFLLVNDHVGIVGSGVQFISQNGSLKGERKYPETNSEIQNNLLNEKFPFCGAGVMIRKEVYLKIGGYRDYFEGKAWDDHDWLFRSSMHFKGANVPEMLYQYRDNPESFMRNIGPMDYKKFTIKKIAIALGKQRILTGSDFLEDKDFEGLKNLEELHEKPFKKDPSLIYRIMAARAKTNSEKIYLLKKAIKKNIFELRNYYYFLKMVTNKS